MRIAESEKIKKTFAFNVDIFTRLNCYNLELIKRPHFDILVGMESKISVEFRINGGK